MRKISSPKYTYLETVDTLERSIERNTGNLKKNLDASKLLLHQSGSEYEDNGKKSTLHAIQPHYKNNEEIILGELTVNNFKRLYEYYLREKKTGRVIYDHILNSSLTCPFCSGIGRSRNLDHFLPQKFFPQFSVLPLNLVPSCRDCNMGEKGENYSSLEEEQLIHPYLDKDIFFTDKWVHCKLDITPDNRLNSVSFYAQPPESWSQIDIKRAQKHFTDFDIADQYATQASTRLNEVLSSVRSWQDRFPGITSEIVVDTTFSSTSEELVENSWQKATYQALLEHYRE